jgi:hypothetical protein
VKVVAIVPQHYYLFGQGLVTLPRKLVTFNPRQAIRRGAFMNRLFVILALGSLAAACSIAVNTNGPSSGATEGSLLQADRDFVATHARGIDGWMSFYQPDAIRIRYRGNMVKGFDEIRKFDLPGISDTTAILNWEPTDAYVFRGRRSHASGYSFVIAKNPVPFWGTGLATGGPPVLQARPVALIVRQERQQSGLVAS